MTELARINTDIPGFDEVLGGGIPRDYFLLIAGTSGTGKTVLSSNIAYNLAKNGTRVLYVSFDEGKRLLNYMKGFGWNTEPLIKSGNFSLLDLVTIKASGVDDYVNYIITECNQRNIELLIIDSLTTLILSIPEIAEARIVLDMLRKLKPPGATIIATANVTIGSKRIGLGVEEIVADGLLLLKRYIYQDEVRIRLLVLKLRGCRHSKRFHEFIITPTGVQVIPIA